MTFLTYTVRFKTIKARFSPIITTFECSQVAYTQLPVFGGLTFTSLFIKMSDNDVQYRPVEIPDDLPTFFVSDIEVSV